LFDYFEAVAIAGYYFARVIGQDADAAEAEVYQDLGADTAFALDQALAAQVVLHFVTGMEADPREFGGVCLARRVNLKAAAGVMKVDEHATIFGGDGFERALDDGVAIAG
jgi:hypothetical protein